MPLLRFVPAMLTTAVLILASLSGTAAAPAPRGEPGPPAMPRPFACTPPPGTLEHLTRDDPAQTIVPGVVVVQLREDAPLSGFRSLLGDASPWCAFPDGRTYIVTTTPGNELTLAAELRRSPQVASAGPDRIRRLAVLPNDPRVGEQWALAKVRAPQAWDVTTGSSAIIIAVLDSGVDGGHPDLKGKLLDGFDFANDRPNAQDDNGHGTHVAGIAAANSNNSIGVAGMSWGARILPIKVTNAFGSTTDTTLASAIRYAADRGARIINMSLGGPESSDVLRAAVDYAYEKGALLVAAAGNCYSSGDACRGQVNAPMYPAAFDRVISVGATTSTDRHAAYSQTGAYLKLTAPGGDPTASGEPDSMRWILSTYWRSGLLGSYGALAGTSQAAPHVSGLAALVWSVNPHLSNAQVEHILTTTAVDLGDPGRDPVFGFGRIDAFAAVKAAQALPAATPTPPSGPTPTPPPGPGTPTPTPGPTVSRTLPVATGGEVQLGAVTVAAPPGVVTNESQVTVTLALFTPALPAGEGTVLGSSSFSVTLQGASGREITALAQPLMLTARYTDADLLAAAGDPNNVTMGVLDEAAGRWVRIPTTTNAALRTVSAAVTHLTKFSVTSVVPGPVLTAPAEGTLSIDMAPLLRWQNPANTTQFQVQVVPFNNDGPAINLIIGQADLVQQAQFAVPAPVMGQGNYIMLPGMTYTWRVRTTPQTRAMGENDAGWSAWQSRSFRTGAPTSATIAAVSPPGGATVSGLTPTLTWANSNAAIFYYEVQLSKDPAFETDPRRATAAVYWNLVHGGQTMPANTYTVPTGAPLEPRTRYYWRVRPRVQGDGIPAAWSDAWTFLTP